MRSLLLATAVATAAAQGVQLILRDCAASGGTYSRWSLNASDSTIYLNGQLQGKIWCIDIENYSTEDNATVWTYQCTGE
jgi:hypothetical protein